MLISECFVLCVSDVDQIPVFSHAFVPDPDIGNVPVTGIAVQSGGDVSLQVNAVWICGDGVVPAVHGRWFQNQPLFRGDGLRIADPVVDVDGASVGCAVSGGAGGSVVGSGCVGAAGDFVAGGSVGCGGWDTGSVFGGVSAAAAVEAGSVTGGAVGSGMGSVTG